jgi:hypothetical protein
MTLAVPAATKIIPTNTNRRVSGFREMTLRGIILILFERRKNVGNEPTQTTENPANNEVLAISAIPS